MVKSSKTKQACCKTFLAVPYRIKTLKHRILRPLTNETSEVINLHFYFELNTAAFICYRPIGENLMEKQMTSHKKESNRNNSDGKASPKQQKSPEIATDTQGV